MSSGYQIIFFIFINHVLSDTHTTITTLNLNDIWTDDFQLDGTDGESTGWSSDLLFEGEDTLTYHGPFNAQGTTDLYRYFSITSYSLISISFDFIWACNPESTTDDNILGDYLYVTLGGVQSQEWSYSTDDTSITLVYDSTITDICPEHSEGMDHAWSKHITFEAMSEPNSEYLVEITSYLSNIWYLWREWDEFVVITNIRIDVEPLCDLTSFEVDAEIIEQYLESVSDVKCRNSLYTQLMEDKYGIDIVTEDEVSTDDAYFAFDGLTPSDITSMDALDITDDDREIIADLFDAEIADMITTEDDMDVLCPKLRNIYDNIVELQRRMLMGIDPSMDDNNAVLMERDNFCSYTDRISTDMNNEGEYTIDLQDAVITIPYVLVNTGREEWRVDDMDSVDITVLCVDNVLINECNPDTETSDNFAVNIDIDVDSTDYDVPFTITFPYSEENKDTVCAWVESAGETWQYDGCNTIPSEDTITCECTHRTVFSLIKDLRTSPELQTAKALQMTDIYIALLAVYSVIGLAATYLVITLYRINDIKSLASIIVSVITAQIYSHVMQYAYLSFAELQSIPLGVTYCVISLPLLCHFWVCSLLILHWMKIFECAKTFSASNTSLDIAVIVMNVIISVVFIALLISSMAVPEHMLSSVVSASNAVLGFVGISICIAWFYFGYKTSSILMTSAKRVKDTCTIALSEALNLRRRLLRLTFIIGLCFSIQSIIAILSSIEHLQLFGNNFVKFATIWAICDIIIFLTFILFYKTHVLRQKQIYMMDLKERELELEARKHRRDKSYTQNKSRQSVAVETPEPSLFGRLRKMSTELTLPRLSIFDPKPRKSTTFTLPPTIEEGEFEEKPVLRPSVSSNMPSPAGTPSAHHSSTYGVPTIENMRQDGSRLSIVSNSTVSTMTTLRNASASIDSATSSPTLKPTRSRSRDDSYLETPSSKTLKPWMLDNGRVRSHSASRSRSVKSRTASIHKKKSSVDKGKNPELKATKSASKAAHGIKTKKLKRSKIESDAQMKKRKNNKNTSKRQHKSQTEKIRVQSDSLVKTKKKINKGESVKSEKGIKAKSKGMQKKTKRTRLQTNRDHTNSVRTRSRTRSKSRGMDKKSKTQNKTENTKRSKNDGKLKPKQKKKEYDENKIDEEIEKALHEVHEKSNSLSSIRSVKDMREIIQSSSLKLKNKSRNQSGIESKPKLKHKSKLKPSKNKTKTVSKKSKIKPKDKKKKQKADK